MKTINYPLNHFTVEQQDQIKAHAIKIGYRETELQKLLFRFEDGKIVIRDNYMLANTFPRYFQPEVK